MTFSGHEWWQNHVDTLKTLLEGDADLAWVYNVDEVEKRMQRVLSAVPAVSRCCYAVKANDHPEIVSTAVRAGLILECVSLAEVKACRKLSPGATIVLTSNFAPVSEYVSALNENVELVLDGPEIIGQLGDHLSGAAIGLRIDTATGDGHHEKVVTAGPGQKFGCDLDMVKQAVMAAAEVGARIVGLHAHSGSGITDAAVWSRVGAALLDVLRETVHPNGDSMLPHLQWINVGGGLGVADGPDHIDLATGTISITESEFAVKMNRAKAKELDLSTLQAQLAPVREQCDAAGLQLRLEPGRFFVAPAGVLLAQVTQVRTKGSRAFIGATAGMHTLLRPALYGSYHSIVNLDRLGCTDLKASTVVGPICESGDVLGSDRPMPTDCAAGETLLISNGGAYGAVMSSHYNRKRSARTILVRIESGRLVVQ